MPPRPAVGESAEPFALDDQFEAAHHVAFGEGRAVVLVFADRASAEDVRPWARRLGDALGERARVVGVAAVGAVPALFHGVVRAFLKDQPSILLDFENRVSDRFGYEGRACLVVAVDPAGRVCARVRGGYNEARYAEVAAALGN